MCVYDRYARGQKSEFDVETFCEQASVAVFGVVDFTAIAISDMVLRKTSFQVILSLSYPRVCGKRVVAFSDI